jgi:hypothetical protein
VSYWIIKIRIELLIWIISLYLYRSTFNSVGNPASTIRLSDVSDYRRDESTLCKECMMHTCSSYCMRHPKGKKNRRRLCRAGAGEEQYQNLCDTPGFPLRTEPTIELDKRGFHKLLMARNNLRMVQTPLHILRGWRKQIMLLSTGHRYG